MRAHNPEPSSGLRIERPAEPAPSVKLPGVVPPRSVGGSERRIGPPLLLQLRARVVAKLAAVGLRASGRGTVRPLRCSPDASMNALQARASLEAKPRSARAVDGRARISSIAKLRAARDHATDFWPKRSRAVSPRCNCCSPNAISSSRARKSAWHRRSNPFALLRDLRRRRRGDVPAQEFG